MGKIKRFLCGIDELLQSINYKYLFLMFLPISLVVSSYLIITSGFHLPTILMGVLFVLLLWLAQNLASAEGTKYLLVSLSFMAFLGMILTFRVEYNQLRAVAFYVPLIYVMLLEDFFVPLLTGLVLSFIFYTYNGLVSSQDLLSNTIGLIAATACYIVIFALIRRLSKERGIYRNMVNTDPMTGVASLSYILQMGQTKMETSRDVAVILIDLDYFKEVNETYGRNIGNNVLIQVAQILKAETADLANCLVGRFGGDEFIILVEDFSPLLVGQLKQRLLNILQDMKFQTDPQLEPVKLSFSAGEACATTEKTRDIEHLIRAADSSLAYKQFDNGEFVEQMAPLQKELEEKKLQLLHVLAEKDMYTYVHSKHTAHYAAALGKAAGLPTKVQDELYIAGWLHDLGKLLLSNEILRKTTNLTEQEYRIVQRHVEDGIRLIGNLELSPRVINAIKCHHERWDGKGYPNRLAGENIPVEGRILEIADAFAAMTIKRVYHRKTSREGAMEEIRKNAGEQFDPRFAEIFLQILGEDNQKEMQKAIAN